MQFFLGDKDLNSSFMDQMGSKARNLHILKSVGLAVPPGFILLEEVANLERSIELIGGFPVAVRSSGSLEDLPNASFAGLYETFLFINSHEELQAAISKCFASKDSDRVQDYLKTKNINIPTSELSMSVLVQKMITPEIAGVLFTLNPTNGREEECYVELCQGVGERLVSGHVTPTTIRYDWLKGVVLDEVINSENTQISEAELRELISVAIKIQAHYGTPQDIEWAIAKDNKLYILQSRPITTFTAREDTPELTNADFKDGGVSARVCTPFMYSVYREALKYSMGDYFKKINLIPNDEKIKWIHYHYGRVYWNAEAVKEGLKKIPDFREEDFDRDLGLQKDYGTAGPHRTPFSISTVVGAIPVLIGLTREFEDCKTMISHFRVRFETQDAELKEQLPSLNRMSDGQFNNWFLKVILFQNETEKNYFRTIYNNSNFQSEYKSFLKKMKTYQDGDEIDLMGELHGVAHLDVQSGLAKLRKIVDFYGLHSDAYYKSREEFLKIHYHHGPAELDLLVPRWGENKKWVDDLVQNFIEMVPSLEYRFKKTSIKLTEGMNIFQKNKFHSLTGKSRDYLRLREEMRSFSTRAYYLLRLGMLEFVTRRKLEIIDGFMLDVLEVKRNILNPDSKLPDTSLRKLYYEGYRNFNPPNDFGGSIKSNESISSDGMKGLGCSPGEITGRARIILDIHATGQLTKEEILVTKFTDPGWTPVLARVGGVVTEVGGLLSHAAVIGREYGIPAILNLVDATRKIDDGDLIKINGKTGIVEILEKGSKG